MIGRVICAALMTAAAASASALPMPRFVQEYCPMRADLAASAWSMSAELGKPYESLMLAKTPAMQDWEAWIAADAAVVHSAREHHADVLQKCLDKMPEIERASEQKLPHGSVNLH